VLLGRATWISWVVYTAALLLAAGSRHINLILLIWLPGTVVLLWLWSFLAQRTSTPDTQPRRSRSFPAILSITALLCTAAAYGADKIVLSSLCRQFGVIERSSLGSAMSGRIGTWVDKLSPERKRALLDSVQRLTNDPLVKLAIQFQIEI